jgi:hypothetical protein
MKTKPFHRIKIGFRILGDEAPLYLASLSVGKLGS